MYAPKTKAPEIKQTAKDLFLKDQDLFDIDTEMQRLEKLPYLFPNDSKREQKLDMLRHMYTFTLAGLSPHSAMRSWMALHQADLYPVPAPFDFECDKE